MIEINIDRSGEPLCKHCEHSRRSLSRGWKWAMCKRGLRYERNPVTGEIQKDESEVVSCIISRLGLFYGLSCNNGRFFEPTTKTRWQKFLGR